MSELGSLLRFFLDTKVRRRRIHLMASFKLTNRCNLTCRGCPNGMENRTVLRPW